MTRLAELRALLAKATPGPWEADNRGLGGSVEDHFYSIGPMRADITSDGDAGPTTGIDARPEDAALVVAAVNALPALLDVAEAAWPLRAKSLRGVYGDDARKLAKAFEALAAVVPNVHGGEK